MDAARLTGPWTAAQAERFLEQQAIPLRLGCLTPRGWPLVVSHWFLYRDGLLWCAAQADAKVVHYLRADPRCAFEIATEDIPYRGVRGQGRAHLDPAAGDAVLRALTDRYLGGDDSAFARWLLSRTGDEVAIRIEPRRWRSWDFTRRMRGAAPQRG
jgi:nitroimidazol reductase NimA-like FMN-containing flavoprotein (pyridoxamine 5'-phosphate oxidase superfamily)